MLQPNIRKILWFIFLVRGYHNSFTYGVTRRTKFPLIYKVWKPVFDRNVLTLSVVKKASKNLIIFTIRIFSSKLEVRGSSDAWGFVDHLPPTWAVGQIGVGGGCVLPCVWLCPWVCCPVWPVGGLCPTCSGSPPLPASWPVFSSPD